MCCLLSRWGCADPHWDVCTHSGCTHPLWGSGADDATCSWTTTAPHCLLEFPWEWGRHPSVQLPGQRQRWWVPPWREPLQAQECPWSAANWWATTKLSQTSILCLLNSLYEYSILLLNEWYYVQQVLASVSVSWYILNYSYIMYWINNISTCICQALALL